LPALNTSLNRASQSGITTFFDLIHSAPYDKIEAVASDKLVDGDMTGSGSIEGFHGNYHMNIGGYVQVDRRNVVNLGHMSDVPVAAFDPVFWFHHCQIDRIWELWRAFHPNAWFPEPRDSTKLSDAKKNLLPFYKERKGKFFTSDDTKDTTALGYIYDDFVGPANKLLDRLHAKYNWMRVKPNDAQIRKPEDHMKPLYDKVHASYFMTGLKNPKTTTSGVPRPVPSGRRTHALTSLVATPAPAAAKIDPVFDREWYVDSAVLRSAADGPFTIFFFLALQGELPADADAASLAQSPFLAGINHMFVASSRACDNCGNLEALGHMSSDTTPITPLLLTYLDLEDNGLESLRPEHVKPFLVKYLRWRVVFVGFSFFLSFPAFSPLKEQIR
jgi:tyrosinase